MNFERTGDIKKSMGIGVESYNPLKVRSSFIIRYFLKGRSLKPVGSLFGTGSGHNVLRELEKDVLDREAFQKLFCVDTPILEIYEVRFRYASSSEYTNAVEMPYLINYIFEFDEHTKYLGRVHGRPSEFVGETPILFDNNLYFIKTDDAF